MGDVLGQQGGLVIVHKDSMGIRGAHRGGGVCYAEFGLCCLYSVGFFWGCGVLFG